jgi:AraC family transcriptional regulator of adaptative response/methylated-DNA-[protein]-cysteine methyltransferase
MNTKHDTETRDDSRWRAVLARAPRRDFYYAVVTTGVVCESGCPSRPPRRENVRFFDTLGHALAAGYRPCKRCVGRADDLTLVTAMCRALDQGAAIAEVAQHHGMTSRHLQRTFKAVLGTSPKQYQIDRRIERFLCRVRRGERIVDAAYAAGFPSMSRLHEQLKRRTGLSPTQHREITMSSPIFYAIETTPIGTLLLAQSAKGLCFAGLYDDPERAAADLDREFSEAETIAVGAAQIEPIASAFQAALAGNGEALARLPLDVRGTTFQQAVWDAVRKVPAGERVSYAELARHIRRPRAARAVAGALASNRIAIAIPCHRVVPGDGRSEGGYRWGAARKTALLARETKG